jgi:hypothetical protein
MCARARAPTHDNDERLGSRALAYDELAVKLFEALFSAVSTHACTRIYPTPVMTALLTRTHLDKYPSTAGNNILLGASPPLLHGDQAFDFCCRADMLPVCISHMSPVAIYACVLCPMISL